jgi:hypothetical protein
MQVRRSRLIVWSAVLAGLVACGRPRPAPQSTPSSPAAQQFAEWLAAFDRRDRAELLDYHRRAFPYKVANSDLSDIDREIGLSTATGGFDIKKSEADASATTISAILGQRRCDEFARATMRVETTAPHRVISFQIDYPFQPPEEMLPAEIRSVGAQALDDAARHAVVEWIAREIKTHYIFPVVGSQMIVEIREHALRGDYNAITDGDQFAQTVTNDLRAVSHDLHLMIFFGRGPMMGPPPARADVLASIRAVNFGFGAIERLEPNIARVVINGFVPVDYAREGVGELMTQVADADALIVDLRDNGGGDPDTVAFVASYLFDSTPMHVNDMFLRDEGVTLPSWTLRDLSGRRFGAKKPVFVLTSRRTISGGEELAYDLQSIHRAKVIGETTAGAANAGFVHALNARFAMFVPGASPINPYTKSNWEGKGVEPDVKVAADRAMDVAKKMASDRIRNDHVGEK